MARVRNISGDLHSTKAGGRVRSARLPKENSGNKQERSRSGTQTVRTIRSKANVVSEGPPYEEFDSVWDALGFTSQEAANLEARSELMIHIRQVIAKSGWTQAVAAKRCRVSQPRVNDLLRGKIDKFSVDALMNMASALGSKVRIELEAA